VSTSEVDTWHYIKKLKIFKNELKIIILKKNFEKKKKKKLGAAATPLAGLGWPNHPLTNKKKIRDRF
jgi:hypothetical protein